MNGSEENLVWLRNLRDARRELETALSALSARESTTIRLRFGLDDGIQHTLEDVAKLLDVTRERVRLYEIAGIAGIERARARLTLDEAGAVAT